MNDTIPSPPPDEVAECERCGRVSESVAPALVRYYVNVDGPGYEETEELLLCGGCRDDATYLEELERQVRAGLLSLARRSLEQPDALGEAHDAALTPSKPVAETEPACSGEWLSGSGGHRMFGGCARPATWVEVDGGAAACDQHLGQHARTAAEPVEGRWVPLIDAKRKRLNVTEGERYLFAVGPAGGWEYFSDSVIWDAESEPQWHDGSHGWALEDDVWFRPLPAPPAPDGDSSEES